MVQFTKGFKSVLHAVDHFGKHGSRLGILTVHEYEERADTFWGQSGCETFIRPWNGDIVRYNRATEEFGIVDVSGCLKTFYIPDPLVHGEADNDSYFEAEKKKAI